MALLIPDNPTKDPAEPSDPDPGDLAVVEGVQAHIWLGAPQLH